MLPSSHRSFLPFCSYPPVTVKRPFENSLWDSKLFQCGLYGQAAVEINIWATERFCWQSWNRSWKCDAISWLHDITDRRGTESATWRLWVPWQRNPTQLNRWRWCRQILALLCYVSGALLLSLPRSKRSFVVLNGFFFAMIYTTPEFKNGKSQEVRIWFFPVALVISASISASGGQRLKARAWPEMTCDGLA